jgi:antitoxin YefM
MESTYYLNSNELNEDVIKAIKTLFRNRKIAITVSVEEDETEYLLKSENNKKRLLKSLDNVKKGKNLVSVAI